jgi:glycosyltransferase involved in cell wall biosynthesis
MIKVSVCIITYNQKSYIEQCLLSVLNQQLDCDYEIIIGDDCSTDGTSNICSKYADEYPGLIKYFPRTKNLGMGGNWVQTVTECKGKYIALCDGDDYWVDNFKLQTQLNFLEMNSNFSCCFTDFNILNEKNHIISESNLAKILRFNKNGVFKLENIITRNFIPTLTVMYRNTLNYFPNNFEKMYPMDWPLHVLNAKTGYIKYIPIVSSVYRKHDNGICSSSNPLNNYKKYLRALVTMRTWFNKPNLSIKASFFKARSIIYTEIIIYFIKLSAINCRNFFRSLYIF